MQQQNWRSLLSSWEGSTPRCSFSTQQQCSYSLHMRNVNNSCRSRVCKRMLCEKLRVERKESCRPTSRGRTSEHRTKGQLGLTSLLGCPIRHTLKWLLECSYKVNMKKIKIQVNGTMLPWIEWKYPMAIWNSSMMKHPEMIQGRHLNNHSLC